MDVGWSGLLYPGKNIRMMADFNMLDYETFLEIRLFKGNMRKLRCHETHQTDNTSFTCGICWS